MEPIMAAAVITVIGVGIQVGLGRMQSEGSFEPKNLVSSAIISLFTAFAIMVSIISALPDDLDQLTQFFMFIGTVASIAGIDQLAKNTGGALLLKKKFGSRESRELYL